MRSIEKTIEAIDRVRGELHFQIAKLGAYQTTVPAEREHLAEVRAKYEAAFEALEILRDNQWGRLNKLQGGTEK